MPVTVVCECQGTFELKDEFAGTLVQCPTAAPRCAPASLLAPKTPRSPGTSS